MIITLPDGHKIFSLAENPNNGKDLRGADFRYVDPGLDLSNYDLRGADFSHEDLNGVNFSRAYLSSASFRSTSLIGANFTLANVSNADFQHANLWNAVFDLAVIEGANFTRAYAVKEFLNIAEWGPFRVFSGRWVKCGCRWFTKSEALQHWGTPDRPRQDNNVRINTVRLLDFCIKSGYLKDTE